MLIFNDYEAFEQILPPCRRQRESHTKPGHRERPAQGQHEAQSSIGLVEQSSLHVAGPGLHALLDNLPSRLMRTFRVRVGVMFSLSISLTNLIKLLLGDST
jgi:hypothetical protein